MKSTPSTMILLVALVACVFHATEGDHCVEKTLETREEEANVVMTGTVHELMQEQKHEHHGMYKCEVEIKRVIKGDNVIKTLPESSMKVMPDSHMMVMVDGFGDPHICGERDVRKYDTRIFLLGRGENGVLKLNSSLVRITLRTLLHTDAVVNKVPFVAPPPPKEEPCDRKYCAFGAVCMVNKTSSEAYCQCSEECTAAFVPVCGTDGVTYSSECHLRAQSCSIQRRIKIKKNGKCGAPNPCEGIKCNYNAKCVPSLNGVNYRCQCEEKCLDFGDSIGSTTVCGSDGVTYKNLCELKRGSCLGQKSIEAKYDGACDPCSGHECPNSQICQIDEKRNPICRCNGYCTFNFKPVCASNGMTYSNECIMRVEGCKIKKKLRVLSLGECNTSEKNPCRDKKCPYGSECSVDLANKAACSCPQNCDKYVRPICGSDGQSYDNVCEMMKSACQALTVVTKIADGLCGLNGPCKDHVCDYGAKCVSVGDSAVCECPSCSRELKPVCGSDGITYENECQLREENCQLKRTKPVTVQYEGNCKGCFNKTCDFYSICESFQGGIRCVCPAQCVKNIEPVCGTDGISYSSECELKVASCKRQQFVQVHHKGSCDACSKVRCKFGAVCENGHCMCPQVCAAIHKPICASDDKTYNNECEMRRAACRQSVDLTIESDGECDDTIVSSGSGSGDGVDVCDESTCKYGGVCVENCDKGNCCLCSFNCPAVRSPVCGSNGKMYGNGCQLKQEQCRRQVKITQVSPEKCDDIFEAQACDGKAALQKTGGVDYDCSAGKDTCPVDSYCHRGSTFAKCCKDLEPVVITSCKDSEFGCCPDGETSSPGPNDTGCPSVCQCNLLGSYYRTCNATTKQCSCRPGVGGRRCDQCILGFWGMRKIKDGAEGCSPCSCDMFGSVRDDCEQHMGRCMCKPGVMGMKCDTCPDGKVLTSDGCVTGSGSSKIGKSCKDMNCKYGATCKLRDGQPLCVCEIECSSNHQVKVCGSDQVTYGSICQLKMFSCRLQIDITEAYQGECREISTTESPPPEPTTRELVQPPLPELSSAPTTSSPYGVPFLDSPAHGKIGDICFDDEYCKIANSNCIVSFCECKSGYEASPDNLQCKVKGTATSPPPLTPPPPPLLTTLNIAMTTPSSPCDQTVCQNGGLCHEDKAKAGGYKCECLGNWKGDTCTEKYERKVYKVPTFTGKSYMELKKIPNSRRETVIEIEFRTLNNDAVLLYNGQKKDGTNGDFISLTIKNGYVEFRYDLGAGSPTIIRSSKKISLNDFHHVRASRKLKNGELHVDKLPPVKGHATAKPSHLNLVDPLYLGFVPNMHKTVADGIGVTMGLHGCIRMLKLGNQAINLVYPTSKDIIKGKGIGECGNNPCGSMPCKNGAACIQVDSSNFKCNCKQGFKGTLCQFVDPCEPNPCQDGGSCILEPGTGARCLCMPGRSGDRCQKKNTQSLFTPEFQGDSYIERPLAGNPSKLLAVEIWIMAKSPIGVLVYGSQNSDGSGDYYSLTLDNGFLEFMFDLGAGPATMRSPQPIKMNTWYAVAIERRNRQGTMIINGETTIRGQSKGSAKNLNILPSLIIGGYIHSQVNKAIRISTGFVGAIQRIYINGQLFDDLMVGAKGHSHVTEYKGLPCSNLPCKNEGTCVPKLDNFSCRCTVNYTGKNCENEVGHVDKDRPVMFNGATYLHYHNQVKLKQRSQQSNKFSIKFRTKSENDGLLLLIHKHTDVRGDYLSLAVVDGYIELSYNLGKQSKSNLHIIRSNVKVDDDRWHTVTVTRDKRQGSLQVDNLEVVQGLSGQGANQLDTDGTLWIGGKRNPPMGLPKAYYNGFHGCIGEIYIDDKLLHLVNHRQNSHKMALAFCSAT